MQWIQLGLITVNHQYIKRLVMFVCSYCKLSIIYLQYVRFKQHTIRAIHYQVKIKFVIFISEIHAPLLGWLATHLILQTCFLLRCIPRCTTQNLKALNFITNVIGFMLYFHNKSSIYLLYFQTRVLKVYLFLRCLHIEQVR